MQSTSANNKRIAKNTMFLYIRMGVSMLVGLYTSRIVLNALGVENYGIYNIVGSFIVAFTFISGPLGTATQRFLNFELGKGPDGRLNKVFNLSFYTYVVLSILLLCVIEIAGIWFLNHKMQMPVERRDAAFFAFHMSVLTLLLNLLKTPFESLIIAYERMSFYAYISIADVLLKLINAFLLLYVSLDKLKIFAANILVISAIVICVTVVYCRRNFKNVKIQVPRKNWDLPLFKELVGFSGWSLFGSVASMSANQGLNLLLNMFFGVIVNAAMGIANQVNAAVVQFVNNFQVAFRPQLVKYYAQGNIDALKSLIINTSKYSYLLLFAIVCPVCFNIDLLLKLWLKNPPEYAAEFCIMMLIYALLETLSAPMWMTVQATGKIKRYQIVISSVIFLNIIISYLFLKAGFGPVIVLIVKCCLDVVYLIVRLIFMKVKIQFPIKEFLLKTLLPVFLVTIPSVSVVYAASNISENEYVHLGLTLIIFGAVYLLSVFFLGLNAGDRLKIRTFIKNKRLA
jgi:O-antigen/teichoic acid export membrane protein